MENNKLGKTTPEQTLAEKAFSAIGSAFLICLGLIIFFMIFLAVFIKGVINGWF